MDIRRKKIIKSSVRSSVEKLLERARSSFDAGKQERSIRYVRMAMDLIRKHKVGLPKEMRNSFCRRCLVVWVPGKTANVSFDRKNGCLRIRCRCGYSKRL
jgi:ribonuclease P protein subunit RPR2